MAHEDPFAYPCIPLVEWGTRIGHVTDRVLTLLLMTCLVINAVSPNNRVGMRRAAWAGAFFSLVLLILADQHRLQPWLYQTVLLSAAFSWMGFTSERASQTQGYVRVLFVSIYLCSALGKLDFQFLHTVGQDFARTAFGFAGIDFLGWDSRPRLITATCFPVVELLLGTLLLVPATRKVAAVLVAAMHLGIFTLLSPLGLGHSLGVLIWNLVMAFAVLALFFPSSYEQTSESHPSREPSQKRSRFGLRLTQALFACAILFPLAERTGYWDHWQSWSLYSPHNSRVSVQLHSSALRELTPRTDASSQPDAARDSPALANLPWIGPDDDEDGWHSVSLADWSLHQRAVPVLPQSRYQVALLHHLSQQPAFRSRIRGIHKSVSDRWTGEREETYLLDQDDLARALAKHWMIPSTKPASRHIE